MSSSPMVTDLENKSAQEMDCKSDKTKSVKEKFGFTETYSHIEVVGSFYSFVHIFSFSITLVMFDLSLRKSLKESLSFSHSFTHKNMVCTSHSWIHFMPHAY